MGKRQTVDWHQRFPTYCLVYDHLHIRSTYYRDGVSFTEVSLGYPPNWQQSLCPVAYLREIIPSPQRPLPEEQTPTICQR